MELCFSLSVYLWLKHCRAVELSLQSLSVKRTPAQTSFPSHWQLVICAPDDRDSIFFRYLTTAAALCTGGPVQNVSPLICTASAFSERYLGMPLRDDSRYQVRVYHLPSLVCCWSLKEACCRATDTPTVKLLSKAAMLCLFLCFSCSVGFCHSSPFGNWVHRSHAGGFLYKLLLLLQKGRPALSGLLYRLRCWALTAVFKVFASTLWTAE